MNNQQFPFATHLTAIAIFAIGVLLAIALWPAEKEFARSPLQDEQATLAYWTPTRLAAAAYIPTPTDIPPLVTPQGGDDYGYADMPRPYETDPIARVTGVLFAHDPVANQDTHCTASVVQSRSKSVIVTAARCLASYNPSINGMSWAERLVFIPAYDAAQPKDLLAVAPYGLWVIRRAYVPRQMAERAVPSPAATQDLGVASVLPHFEQRLEDVVGGGLPAYLSDEGMLGPGELLGYPAGRYDGNAQLRCATVLPSNRYHELETPECGIVSGLRGGPIVVGGQLVGVIHGKQQTRLRSDIYPALAAAASSD